MNTYSLLDFNLGLCLSYQKNPNDPRAAHNWLARLSFRKKIAELKKLLSDTNCSCSLAKWADTASSVRAIRNSAAHGVWEYLPFRRDKPVGLRVPGWHTLADEISHEMSVETLEEIANEIQKCFSDFMHWRNSFRV